jgi:hypothetical protein
VKRSKVGHTDEFESVFSEPATPKGHRIPSYVWFLLWNVNAAMCFIILICGYMLGALFFFTHGWSVGWPIPARTVVSTGVTLYSSFMLMTASAGAGAIVMSICALFRLSETKQVRLYYGWLCVSAVVIACLSALIFTMSYTAAPGE